VAPAGFLFISRRVAPVWGNREVPPHEEPFEAPLVARRPDSPIATQRQAGVSQDLAAPRPDAARPLATHPTLPPAGPEMRVSATGRVQSTAAAPVTGHGIAPIQGVRLGSPCSKVSRRGVTLCSGGFQFCVCSRFAVAKVRNKLPKGKLPDLRSWTRRVGHGVQPRERIIISTAASPCNRVQTQLPNGRRLRMPPPGGDVAQRIKKLRELHQSGAITDAEFEAKKAELLKQL
jgi:hypothetical protein